MVKLMSVTKQFWSVLIAAAITVCCSSAWTAEPKDKDKPKGPAIGSITTLSALTTVARNRQAASGIVTSEVIGDSVVDRVRDTLRLVRLMFEDSSARQVAVVGDFNGWRENATHMESTRKPSAVIDPS